MSTNIVFILLLTASYCTEDNFNEQQVKTDNVEELSGVEIKNSAETVQEKVDVVQFHPRATTGEDTTPPHPKTHDEPPQGEQDKEVEPQILRMEIPKEEEKKNGDSVKNIEEEPANVTEQSPEEIKGEEDKTVKVTEDIEKKKENNEEEEEKNKVKIEEVEMKPVDNVADKVVAVPLEEKKEVGESPGDAVIPSFQEFKESQIKKDSEKENVNKVTQEPEAAKEVVKKRHKVEKNYADSACGAKIVARNKESKNSAALLNNNRDLYVMNPCEASIWFVVELCDTVQVEALQLANFELFSSSIENFNVFTSSSYPTKQWKQVGPFTARNNRNLQKFQLAPDGEYSKFVKFEKISHYVKEHFCVMTTFQVLGTSMVEEYEGQQPSLDEVEDEVDPYEESLDGSDKRQTIEESGDKSIIAGARDLANNILGSAMNLLSGSSGDAASQNLTNKTAAPAPEAADNKVVVKVDETGKEIKDKVPELTQSDKLRLKGETGDLAPPKRESKPIMEGVNLKEEEQAILETNPVELHSQEPAPVEPVVPVVEKIQKKEEVEKKEETLEPVKEEETAPERETKEIIGDKEDLKGKEDSKGVIMSSSPKKNSIFVELDKKIKDLEYNLSLSNDYLETLSSRYKKVNNLFKPLEKTLSTFDETMKKFEGRLQMLEASVSVLNNTIQRQIDVHLDGQEYNMNLSTSVNIILFLLTVLILICWRLMRKISTLQQTLVTQRIPFAPPVPVQKKTPTDYQLSNIENIDPKSKGRQSVDIGTKKKKARQKFRKDAITSAGLLFDSVRNKNLPPTTDPLTHSKSTESLMVEVPRSPELNKRKSAVASIVN